MKISKEKLIVLTVILLSGFLSFYKLGLQDVYEWDESRNGVNAFEMLHNNDYVNLYFAGQLDTWNNKPPLLIYCIIISYKIFGLNQFALRFPSALATILFFYCCYKLFSLYTKNSTAFLGCIILMSCKGIIGFHAGRTGDFDALLLLFLTASLYFFLKYHDFNYKKGIYLFSIFMGLAFLTKGVAAFLILPGLFIYVMMRRKLKELLFFKHTWYSLIIFTGIV
ncbi:MAG: glycosyltransferase family 39 protein [Bacteroidia bacterium]